MQRLDPTAAATVMRAASLTPCEPYPGANRPWRCTCDLCGQETAPRYSHVIKMGHLCRHCGATKIGNALRLDDEELAIRALSAGFEILGEYVNANTPLLVRHLSCGSEVMIRPVHFQRRGACVACAPGVRGASKRLKSDDVEAVVLSRGFIPLQPYPGRNEPWLLRHECGQEVAPRLGDLLRGGGCQSCCRYGFDANKASWVYLLHHPVLGAWKIGKTNNPEGRFRRHRANGWAIHQAHLFPCSGHEASRLEKDVLAVWSDLPFGVPADWDGSSETIPSSLMSLEAIFALLGKTVPPSAPFDPAACRVERVSASTIKPLVEQGHYLHSMAPGTDHFGMYRDGVLIGASVVGRPVYPQASAGLWTGDSVQELRRLYVVDEVGKNAESWFLSRVIRSLSCGLLVAYTAPDAGHYGACYQAANFAFHGSVARSSYHYVDDDGRIRHKRSIWDRAKRRNVTEGEYAASLGLVRVEERPKLIYSYLRDRRQIQLGVLPYPKPDR